MSESITREELRESFTRLVEAGDFYCLFPNFTVEKIITDVEDHREPVYEENVPYVDAYGEFWKWDAEYSGWRAFGSCDLVTFPTPKRPLRKMAVED